MGTSSTGLTFVHRDQDIRVWTKCYRSDILAILKRERSRLVTVAQVGQVARDMRTSYSLYKVECRDTVSYRAQDGISVGGENNVPLSVNSATKVRELQFTFIAGVDKGEGYALP